MQLPTNLSIVAACALAALVFVSLGRSNLSSFESSSFDSSLVDNDSRRGLSFISDHIDPKSLERKTLAKPKSNNGKSNGRPGASDFNNPDDFVDSSLLENQEFNAPVETLALIPSVAATTEQEKVIWLNEFKINPPTIDINNYESSTAGSQLVDVVSIGQEEKLTHMMTQSQTWAAGVRHFWGFTENQDFDTSCVDMDPGMTSFFVRTCRSPSLGGKRFGVSMGKKIDDEAPGWFCAQRRPGRALGWLLMNYQGRTTTVPDILILVDADSSVDLKQVKNLVPTHTNIPFIGAGSNDEADAFDGLMTPLTGHGTYFNKAAIERLIQPIYCGTQYDGSAFMTNACEKLSANQGRESELFQEGDSVFDIFYKHASRPNYCMHSAWQLGYMIQKYSGLDLVQLEAKTNRGHYRKIKEGWCDKKSITCHPQTPKEMEDFVIDHPQVE